MKSPETLRSIQQLSPAMATREMTITLGVVFRELALMVYDAELSDGHHLTTIEDFAAWLRDLQRCAAKQLSAGIGS